MAFVTICDRCGAILNDNIDSVKIQYSFKKEGSILQTTKTVHLCDTCYKEYFGNQLEEFKNGGEF